MPIIKSSIFTTEAQNKTQQTTIKIQNLKKQQIPTEQLKNIKGGILVEEDLDGL